MIYSFALFSFKAPPVDPGTLPCLCSVASDDSMLPVLSPFYFYDVGFDLVALFYKELPSLMESFCSGGYYGDGGAACLPGIVLDLSEPSWFC
ncbi:hypothetical protein NL676_009961 [Syzygium grande]|nr:hypothetical protein NL676_009961 [Syzygium grande]